MTLFESAMDYMLDESEIPEIDYGALLTEAQQVLSFSEYKANFREKVKEIKKITASAKPYKNSKDYKNEIKIYETSIKEWEKLYKFINSIPREAVKTYSVGVASGTYGNGSYGSAGLSTDIDPIQIMRDRVYREITRLKKRIAKCTKKLEIENAK